MRALTHIHTHTQDGGLWAWGSSAWGRLGLGPPRIHSSATLSGVAVCCSVLQCVAVCCSVLQCVAVCCSVLQCKLLASLRGRFPPRVHPSTTPIKYKRTATDNLHCNAHTATHTLQHTATHCNTLQHTATNDWCP